MGFEPTTLCDLVGCPNYWASGDSMVSKGEMWVFDWNRIGRSQSQMMSWHIWAHLHGIVTLRHIKDVTDHPPKWVLQGIFSAEILSTQNKLKFQMGF